MLARLTQRILRRRPLPPVCSVPSGQRWPGRWEVQRAPASHLSPGPSMGVEKLTWGATWVEGSQPQPPGCQLTSAKGVLVPGPERTAVMCVMGATLGSREGGARTGQIPHLETLLLPRGSCPLKGS